jgi:hypothetical protein
MRWFAADRSRSPPAVGRARRTVSVVAVLLALPLSLLGVLAGTTGVAQAAVGVSSQVDVDHGFPRWYQDAAGTRVEPCLDPADTNCVVLAGPTFDPLQPTAFPTNFPDEFFYALADSDKIATPGCPALGIAPGTANVRLALEGAFVNGAPAVNEQMVFGRIRVRVTGGLCPNTPYRFKHPFGTVTLTTNGAGAIPANVGTKDVGCAPVAPNRCDFGAATASDVFGTSADGGFLRWDSGAPAGYLGDATSLHAVTGGSNGNEFRILDGGGNDLAQPVATDQFVVAGKVAGSLISTPKDVDLGGQEVGAVGIVKTVTVTNLDTAPVTVPAGSVTLAGPAGFSLEPGADACTGAVLQRDDTCTVAVRFAPLAGDALGAASATLTVATTGGVRSPLTVALTGTVIGVGDVARLAANPTSVAFGDTRVLTASGRRTITLTNPGTAPLEVSSVVLSAADQPETDHFRIERDTCSTGRTVPAGGSCLVDVVFAPLRPGAHTVDLVLASNADTSPDSIPLTGTGTGGIAAVSSVIRPLDGFPAWYRDELGQTFSPCVDATDPNCVLVASPPVYDPNQPLVFPSNYPDEFFYHIADSDLVPTPGCGTIKAGKAAVRAAVEGTFVDGVAVPNEQMVFGRIRITATGLCPNTPYTFVHPYGTTTLTTNGSGVIARNVATEDIGCAPTPPQTCDFSQPLPSRVFGGLLRWDPTVAPAAPAGYAGDGASVHKVVGSPYKADGVNPTNYFEVQRADSTVIGRTSLFSVAGKYLGPLEADPDPVDLGTRAIDDGISDAAPVVLTNTGATPVVISSVTIAGTDAADFTVGAGSCTSGGTGGHTLAPGQTCTMNVQVDPSAVGPRSATLVVRHDGFNDPFAVPLNAIGGAAVGNAAFSVNRGTVTFPPLHTGRVSGVQTVRVSNAGGSVPLDITDVGLTGPSAAEYQVTGNTCTTPVAVGGSCTVDVVFTPNAAGARSAQLVFTSNAPGSPHAVLLNGTGSNAAPAVSDRLDQNGYPLWYSDSNGVRVDACLDSADTGCVLLGDPGFDPALPVAFPTNFPSEFFYAVATSQVLTTPGCGGTPPGTALMRAALEGSFAGGAPLAGDQTTFGRLRITVTSGLCPNVPYTFRTPYGVVSITTNASGGFTRALGTTDVGCGATPCAFGDALASQVADSFLRFDPNVAPAAPAGHLGDAVSFHKVVGGTYLHPTTGLPTNDFVISDSAGNEVLRTDQFQVSGRTPTGLVASTGTLDFGHDAVDGNPVAAQTVTLTNTGTTPVQVTGVALGGAAAADYALTGGSCQGATVAADGTCTVQVQFGAGGAGVRAGTLTVTTADGQTVTVALTGTGDQPAASVTPTSVAFGSVLVGAAPLTRDVTVTNTGSTVLTVGPQTITGSPDLTIGGTTCSTVNPGSSCTVTVRFAATTLGAQTATLTVPHNAAGGPATVTVTGTGIAPQAVVTPTSIDYGSVLVGAVVTRTVTISNPGTAPLVVGTSAVTGSADFTVSATTCATVAPGASCTVTVRLLPTGTGGRTGTLTLSHNAAGGPATVTLTGTGTAAVATVTPSSLAFGNVAVGSTGLRTVTVGNTGNSPLVLGNPTVTGSPRFTVSANTCGTVQPGSTCAVTVRVAPTAAGALTGTLTLPHNGIGGSSTVSLSATGTAPAVSLNPTSVGFGNVVVAQPQTRTVTITNTGTANLTVGTPTITGSTEFTLTGNTCGTMAPGVPCTLTVRFAPTARAARTGTLTIPHNAGGPSTVALTGTGVAARFSVTPSPIAFANTAINTNRNIVVTVRNTGTVAFKVTATTIGGTNPARFTLPVNGCLNTTLAAGATCTLTVRFRPTARVNNSATLVVTGDASTLPRTVTTTITGRGI